MAKVLIVDDDSACRESLRALLSMEDFELAVAADGPQAIDLGRSFVPDVMVVDRMLGGEMDGIQVAGAMRSINPRLKVIVVTGYVTADLESRSESAPSMQYMAKPVVPSELVLAIKKAGNHPT